MNRGYRKIDLIKYKILNESNGSNNFHDYIYDDTRWINIYYSFA